MQMHYVRLIGPIDFCTKAAVSLSIFQAILMQSWSK